MSDDQGEPLEQPELLSVAEVLTEHAEATIRAAWLKQADRQHLEIPESYVHVANVEEAFTAGWRAALEWYIALVVRPPLTELAIATTRRSVQAAQDQAEQLEHEGECGWLLRPLIMPEYPQGMWCHAGNGHPGGHVLGH